MRIKGNIVYYETSKGIGLVRQKGTGEFYFINHDELCVHDLILYDGMEISFTPVIHNQEQLATKIRTMKLCKRGHVLNVNSEEDIGYIADKKGIKFWFKPSLVNISGTKRIQPDDEVQFFKSEGGNHPVQYAYGVACDKRSGIAKFTRTKSWKVHITCLAALAKEESWSYSNIDIEPLPLLENYFIHTFQYVFEQDRIGYFINKYSGMAYACVHTGLESKNSEDIYGIFLKDTKKAAHPFAPYDWAFSHFTDSWMNLLLQCDPLPLPASYTCSNGYDRFDPAIEIRSVIDVILKYQKHLLPKNFLKLGDGHCADMLQQAIDYTSELLKTGKIIPFPKYFYGTIEFVAPLYFEGKQSDVALVIKRNHDSFYYANNLIPLDIAYKNARLLGPVNSEWLKPVYVSSDIPVEQDRFEV